MAIRFSSGVRDARLDVVESHLSSTACIGIFDGTAPTACSAADAGTLLVEWNLPADWMAAANGGSKAISGTWTASATAAGTAQYFRIYNAYISGTTDGTTCRIQGTVSNTAGAGDMKFDNNVFASGQGITVSTFTLTDGNS